MKILLLIRSLNLGGTERQAALLARGLRARGHDVAIAVFYAVGTPLEREAAAAGTRILALGKKSRWDVLGFLPRLIARLRAERPDALYAFLPTANILAVLARPFLSGARVVLGVRASNMDLSRYDALSRFSYWLEGKLAPFADGAVANSEASRDMAVARGFPAARLAVIPNGIDGERFRPDPVSRRALRAAWGIAENASLIGVVARLDPMKGHHIFLEAARRMLDKRPDLRFICVGSGPEEAALKQTARGLNLGAALLFVPERPDAEAALNVLDLVVLPSLFGEGFPNVLGEAMACGLPCVASDVGAAREILGDEGAVVKHGDAGALAEACLAALDSPNDEAARQRRRARIISTYGVEAMVERTEAILADKALESVSKVMRSGRGGGRAA
jgi:glycosyltransferase involved in cell wall biosynthesis